MVKNGLTRRGFIAMAAAGAGGMVFLTRCNNPERYSTYRFFTDEEAMLVDDLVDQIIPPDDWPGAKDAGVTNFIDRQLAGTYARFRDDYRSGLKSISLSCQELFGLSFIELNCDQQRDFLIHMEAGKLNELVNEKDTGNGLNPIWKDGFERRFFRLLRDHTMQGFYGSPRHGGNLNYVSYKMVRLDYPLIIGQNRYNG
jgi:gluconate 2-dehydrogenase gamma chain